MILFFTDFGLTGPYVGQMEAVIRRENPAAIAINLFADVPTCDPRAAAYLLAAHADEFPPPSVFLAVVDPGVGSSRRALVLEADGRWFVGPDNGLFEIAARRARTAAWWEIAWRPGRLSASFHGRDLFAPVAAWLDRGERPGASPTGSGAGAGKDWAKPLPGGGIRFFDWPDDLPEAVYVDSFGNVITGLRAKTMSNRGEITLPDGRKVARARTFSDVPKGSPFWYENANGLVEIAVNGGRADKAMGLAVGSALRMLG